MSLEPIFIRRVEQDHDLHRGWMEKCLEESKAQGCVFGRFSIHPDNNRLALVEAWAETPEDQGDVRWDTPESA